jgi:hypothetical protein
MFEVAPLNMAKILYKCKSPPSQNDIELSLLTPSVIVSKDTSIIINHTLENPFLGSRSSHLDAQKKYRCITLSKLTCDDETVADVYTNLSMLWQRPLLDLSGNGNKKIIAEIEDQYTVLQSLPRTWFDDSPPTKPASQQNTFGNMALFGVSLLFRGLDAVFSGSKEDTRESRENERVREREEWRRKYDAEIYTRWVQKPLGNPGRGRNPFPHDPNGV